MGIGNVLDGFSLAAVRALATGRELVLKSPAIERFCRALRCALEDAPAPAAATPQHEIYYMEWRWGKVPEQDFLEGDRSGPAFGTRRDFARVARVLGCMPASRALARGRARASATRNDGARPPLPADALLCVRARALGALLAPGASELVRGGHGAAALAAHFRGDRERLRAALGLASGARRFDPPLFAAALHLRLERFIESRGRERRDDPAAIAWLRTDDAIQMFGCVARRLLRLDGACAASAARPLALYVTGDNLPVKIAFVGALRDAFRRAGKVVELEYFTGIEPSSFQIWEGWTPMASWWPLLVAAADWLLIARASEVINVHGTQVESDKLPSSFSKTAVVAAERETFDKLFDWYPPGSKARLPLASSGGRCLWIDAHLW